MKIKDIYFPIALAAIILVAGFFALSPIDKATTVHTTVVAAGVDAIIVESGTGNNISDNDTIVIDCDEDFVIIEMYWSLSGHEVDENLNLGNDAANVGITIDGVRLVDEFGEDIDELIFDTGGGDITTPTISWSGLAIDQLDAAIPTFISAEGDGDNDVVFTIFDDDAGQAIDAINNLTVKAIIESNSSATCTVTVNS